MLQVLSAKRMIRFSSFSDVLVQGGVQGMSIWWTGLPLYIFVSGASNGVGSLV